MVEKSVKLFLLSINFKNEYICFTLIFVFKRKISIIYPLICNRFRMWGLCSYTFFLWLSLRNKTNDEIYVKGTTLISDCSLFLSLTSKAIKYIRKSRKKESKKSTKFTRMKMGQIYKRFFFCRSLSYTLILDIAYWISYLKFVCV